MKRTILLILLLSFAVPASAQELPLITESEYNWLVNEISGDHAYEHIRYFTQFHRPRAGSPGLMEVAQYVEEKAREYGLQDVQLIRQTSTTQPWSNHHGELWITSPKMMRLASTLQHPLHLSDYSRSARLDQIEIIEVGEGLSDSDYEGKSVEGKIVLAFGSSRRAMEAAVWERGAAGIITYPDPSQPDYPANALSRPDHLTWTSVPVESDDGKPATFGFRITSRQAVDLLNLLRADEPVLASVDIESELPEEKWQVMVEAYIRGSEIEDQDIVLTGHLQEEKYSANDDASGCASVLEIGRALQKLIAAGRLPRPRRNIRLWWVTEISSQRQYFADHPKAHESMMANINQDMVGADQSQDLLRVQNMTRVPFSRFHYLNDVAERVMEFTLESNKANLAALQAGATVPYPRPILSRLGSRHRYNGEIIPFHNNTDHMTFNEAPIGVPGITFTNWPDNFIHSSDDDLWNVDRTQLQRNAFNVATIAYVMAQAGKDNFQQIASEVGGRSARRMAEDLQLALQWLARSDEFYWRSRYQMEEAAARELRAVNSLEQVRTVGSSDRLATMRAAVESQLRSALQVIAETTVALYGTLPEEPALSDAQQQLRDRVPRLAVGPVEFLTLRQKIGSVPGLHSLMQFETLCFVDGRRDGLQIFRAVAAEARRAGAHYYGTVRAADVLQYLEKAATAGVISW